MPNTRDNGIQVPINADAWNLTGDLATMADTANVATLCINQAAMDALTDRNGRLAIRADLGYALYANDGTNWNAVPLATPYGHMGRTAGFLSLSTSNTVVVMDAAQELAGGMTFDNANDALVIPRSGLYRCTVKLYVSGASSGVKHTAQIQKVTGPTSVVGLAIQVMKHDTSDWYQSNTITVRLSANDKLQMVAAVISGTSSLWGTDGYNGTFLEAEYVRP